MAVGLGVRRRKRRRARCEAEEKEIEMINRYSDHAANERTFLAWVRTSIAVMAFGFLIERFDLFLRFAAREVPHGVTPPHFGFANLIGILFVVIGLAMVVVSTFRFFRTEKEIDAVETDAAPSGRLDLTLSGLLALLGLALLLYLVSAVLQTS
jgi:putative membrane protein